MIFIVCITWLYVNGVEKTLNDVTQFQQQVKNTNN